MLAFESAENKNGVEVRIQQDVSSEETNPCHSKHEPSDECVFTKINNGQIQFRDGDGILDYFEVKSDGAKPNLVRPHRRKFSRESSATMVFLSRLCCLSASSSLCVLKHAVKVMSNDT